MKSSYELAMERLAKQSPSVTLTAEQKRQLLAQVPRSQVHDSLAGFADFLLQRDHVPDSASGGLS